MALLQLEAYVWGEDQLQTRSSLSALTFVAGKRENYGSGWKVGRSRARNASCTLDEYIVMSDAVDYVTNFHLLFDAHLLILPQELFCSK